MISIDEIVLKKDKRGISELKNKLPRNNYLNAASYVLKNKGAVIITTGFWVNGYPETDGPPGAFFLANALERIGFDPYIVTDIYLSSILKKISISNVIDFPITNEYESKKYAATFLGEIKPSILISIERCGFSKDRKYLNMMGVDITEYTAKLDFLFLNHNVTVGIGDGGNEIGMGNLYEDIKKIPSLVKKPSITKVNKILLASVSNWGAYGLITAISELLNQILLPSKEDEWYFIKQLVDCGCVDGFSGKQKYEVDGFKLQENCEIISILTDYLHCHV